jgi:hypothetical protein
MFMLFLMVNMKCKILGQNVNHSGLLFQNYLYNELMNRKSYEDFGDTVWRPVIASRDARNIFALRDTTLRGYRFDFHSDTFICKIVFVNELVEIPGRCNITRRDANREPHSGLVLSYVDLVVLDSCSLETRLTSRRVDLKGLIEKRFWYKYWWFKRAYFWRTVSCERIFVNGQTIYKILPCTSL